MTGIMAKKALMVALVTSFGLAGCSKAPPARTVTEFLDDPIGLEATLARCNEQRGKSRDEPECINAREANNRLAAAEQRDLKRNLELESQRKLDAVRRRNEATAEAGRMAEEAARRREELRYEQQFEDVPVESSAGDGLSSVDESGAAPADLPSASRESAPQTPADDVIVSDPQSVPLEAPATESIEVLEPEADAPTDLNSLREELNRRNQTESDNEPPR